MAQRYICLNVEISDFKKAVLGGHTGAAFHLRIINGLKGVIEASVEKFHTTICRSG
jgi:hypothetical protein